MGRVSSFRVARHASGRRVAVVGVAVALALAAAGCVASPKPPPPPPPTHPAEVCAARAPASAREYQAALDAIYDGRVGGWIANDGGLPVRLPDNRTLWLSVTRCSPAAGSLTTVSSSRPARASDRSPSRYPTRRPVSSTGRPAASSKAPSFTSSPTARQAALTSSLCRWTF